jgi:amino-acid N-acetyltransferase
MGLDWQRFILAIDPYGKVVGCGQLKPHADGSVELASIAVLTGWRGRGVARKIIEHLLEQHTGRIYLTCRSPLGPMYQKFGFQVIQPNEMPPYFRRLSWMVNLINKLLHQPVNLLVMRRN